MRIILIHGFNANPEMNFIPWLKDQLQEKGFEVLAPSLSLRTDQEINLPTILEEVKKQVGCLHGEDIIVGHSLGGLIALQSLQSAEMPEPPRAVLLVASPWKVSKPELRHLFIEDLDADVIMWKAEEFIVIHSEDDKLVPVEHGHRLAAALKARLVLQTSDDHFMGTEYPILQELLLEIANTP